MNFARAQELQKEVLLREGHAFDAANNPVPCGSADQKEAIKAASTAEDMYQVRSSSTCSHLPLSHCL
jgi:hypothetical protein